MISIQKIELPLPGLEQLHAEARAEGFEFIDTLVEQWADATNRFNGPGEALFGCLEDGQLIAVGGLTRDPYVGRGEIGRARRIYVRKSWRRKGIGAALVTALLEYAREHFFCVRLRAESADAGRLYESLGFIPISNPEATHLLYFRAPDESFRT